MIFCTSYSLKVFQSSTSWLTINNSLAHSPTNNIKMYLNPQAVFILVTDRPTSDADHSKKLSFTPISFHLIYLLAFSPPSLSFSPKNLQTFSRQENNDHITRSSTLLSRSSSQKWQILLQLLWDNLTLNSLWQLQKNSGRVDLPFQLHYHRDIETDSPLLLRIIF